MSCTETPATGQLRLASATDAEALGTLYLRARHELLPFAPLAHSVPEVRLWLRDLLIPAGQTWVLEQQGRLSGFVAVSIDPQQPSLGWLDHLYLLPELVGQGRGSLLLAHAMAQLPAQVRLYCFQANTRALAFYRARGFLPLAWGDGSGNEEGCPDVLLQTQRLRSSSEPME